MEKKLTQKPINLVKVVLFGPESTGKTTLSKQLSRHYNTVWAPEFAREYLQNKWNNERKTCEQEDLIPIAIGQMKLENKLAKKADKLLICDTDLLETKVYSEEYYGGFVDPKLNEAAIKNKYDIYFLTYIDTPWEEDDLRDKPEQRLEMFTAFENTLIKYNRPYVLLKGDKETRLKKATEIIDKLISEKNNLYSFSDSLIDLDMHFLHQNIDTNDYSYIVVNSSELIKELKFKAVRSSGAGGQHVNKVSSKVELSFDVFASKNLTDEQKGIISKKLSNRLTKESILILFCDESRSQHRNKEIVIQRFLELIKLSLQKEKVRKATKPSKASIKRKAENKRRQAFKKSLRKKPNID